MIPSLTAAMRELELHRRSHSPIKELTKRSPSPGAGAERMLERGTERRRELVATRRGPAYNFPINTQFLTTYSHDQWQRIEAVLEKGGFSQEFFAKFQQALKQEEVALLNQSIQELNKVASGEKHLRDLHLQQRNQLTALHARATYLVKTKEEMLRFSGRSFGLSYNLSSSLNFQRLRTLYGNILKRALDSMVEAVHNKEDDLDPIKDDLMVSCANLHRAIRKQLTVENEKPGRQVKLQSETRIEERKERAAPAPSTRKPKRKKAEPMEEESEPDPKLSPFRRLPVRAKRKER